MAVIDQAKRERPELNEVQEEIIAALEERKNLPLSEQDVYVDRLLFVLGAGEAGILRYTDVQINPCVTHERGYGIELFRGDMSGNYIPFVIDRVIYEWDEIIRDTILDPNVNFIHKSGMKDNLVHLVNKRVLEDLAKLRPGITQEEIATLYVYRQIYSNDRLEDPEVFRTLGEFLPDEAKKNLVKIILKQELLRVRYINDDFTDQYARDVFHEIFVANKSIAPWIYGMDHLCERDRVRNSRRNQLLNRYTKNLAHWLKLVQRWETHFVHLKKLFERWVQMAENDPEMKRILLDYMSARF